MNWIRACGKVLLFCTLPALLASCAHISPPQPPQHPLVGKVWDVSAQRFVEPQAVLERAVDARFLLLGEIHDNAEHHRLQSRILESVVKRGRRPALVMEQFDIDQQDKVDAILNNGAPIVEKARELSELMRKTWDWHAYEPMVTLALQQGLKVAASNLSRDSLRKVARNGYDALGAGEEARLALQPVWTPARQEQLVHDIYGGHCGKIPDHVAEAIARSQRARDAVMADTLIKFGESGAVAILGRSHAYHDMAVPLYLAARAPDAAVLSLGFMEVAAPVDPAAYASGALGPHFDFVWFTPRLERQVNHCDSIPAPATAASAN